MLKKIILLTLFAAGLPCMMLRAQEDFAKVVSAQHIKQMSTFERAQYTKALQLLNSGQYRAAATEFERFILQYQSSDMKPYMIFLRAYALYMAKDRNKAISIFNEVIDYYPGVVDAAAPALYYRGMAAFANGDYKFGMRAMKELVDDEDYAEHPVAAAASLQLVRNYWRNKEPEKAAQYLCSIFEKFRKKSPRTAELARNYYIAYCMATGRAKEYQMWYLQNYAEEAVAKKLTKEQFRANMICLAYDQVMWNYHWIYNDGDLMQKYLGNKKKGTDPFAEVWSMLQEFRPYFEKGDMMWQWYSRALRLLAGRKFISAEKFEDLVSETCKFVAGVPDGEEKGRQEKRFKEIVTDLINRGSYSQALYVNTRIKDAKTRAWNEYEVLKRTGKWQEAVAQLDKITGTFKDDARSVKEAGYQKGWILRDRLNKPDEAVEVYKGINDPPTNLWQIVECYRRKNDVSNVIRQLIEIENAFPDCGSRAAWERAEFQHRMGNKAQAVKEGRYIMKRYPKSRESSYAHQLLEKYGIETGGGVLDDMQ